MSNAHEGVFDIFHPTSLTSYKSPKSNDFCDFPPFSPSFQDLRGERGGEVSDPPFSVTRRSRRGRPFDTLFDTSVTGGGVAHLCVTARFIPAGRRL